MRHDESNNAISLVLASMVIGYFIGMYYINMIGSLQ